MAICGFGCVDLPAHIGLTCNDEITKGGFSSVGILDCDHSITDFSLATQYDIAITANELILVEPIRGDMPAPSAVTGDNLLGCGTDEILDTFDRTFTWIDGKISEANELFYNALNRKTSFLIMFNCGDDKVHTVLVPVFYQAMLVIPASKKEKATWQITATWNDLDTPQLSNAPVGVFNDN